MHVKSLDIVNCCVATVLCLLVVLPELGFAERPETRQQQQKEMQQMMDMLKKGGMPSEQMQQMQDMFKGMEEQGKGKRPQRSSAKLKKEQQKFEAETIGHGKATVEVEGKRYELTVTKCELWGQSGDRFQIVARQAPAVGDKKLSMGASGYKRIGLTFESAEFKQLQYWREGSGPNDSSLTIEDNIIKWNGLVGEAEDIPATIHVTCGAEMKDYAVASKPKPESAANVVTFQLGKETHTFQAGHCSTKEFRDGNLMVQFEATATGKFRGHPAILLMSKGHPHESTGAQKQTFQQIDLLLGELTAEERILRPLQVQEALRVKIRDFAAKKNAAIKKKYDPQMAAYQEKFDKEMPALKEKYGQQIPQDKMKALMDPFNKLSDAQSKESSQVQEQVKAMRYPTARSNGAFTGTGQDVHYGGSPLRTTGGQRAKEFQNLTADPELWVTCGE